MDYYHDIQRLTPPITGWHIRVKVLRLFRIFLTYPYKRLGLVLANEYGTRIEASVSYNLAEYYDGALEEDKWYTITKFGLTPNTNEFRATAHKFKIYFMEDTIVKQAIHVPVSFIGNNFASFQSITDGSIVTTYLVDLVGAIYDVGPLKNTANNKRDVDGFQISFKIKDKDEHVLDCMALKAEALDFERNYRLHGGGIITVVLRWWKINRYWDGPNSVTISTDGPISNVYINQSIPEVDEVNQMLARTTEDVIVEDV